MVRFIAAMAFVALFLYGATPAMAGTNGRVVVTLTLLGDIPPGDSFHLQGMDFIGPGGPTCGLDPVENPYFPDSKPCHTGQVLVLESGARASGTVFECTVCRNTRRVSELSGRVVVREGTTRIALVYDYNLGSLPNTAVSRATDSSGPSPVVIALGVAALAGSGVLIRRRQIT